MKESKVLVLFLLITIVLGGSKGVFGLPINNPHNELARCLSCHWEEPTGDKEVRILADNVDNTCHICHPYDCCRINSLKGHNHPSNVSEWESEKFTEPKTLPLTDGYITCLTCHKHRYDEGPDHRMVRLVKVGLGAVDWTALCLDCHVDY